jgi:hypothetical protein
MKKRITDVFHFEPLTYRDGTNVEYGYNDKGIPIYLGNLLFKRAVEADAIARRTV